MNVETPSLNIDHHLYRIISPIVFSERISVILSSHIIHRNSIMIFWKSVSIKSNGVSDILSVPAGLMVRMVIGCYTPLSILVLILRHVVYNNDIGVSFHPCLLVQHSTAQERNASAWYGSIHTELIFVIVSNHK